MYKFKECRFFKGITIEDDELTPSVVFAGLCKSGTSGLKEQESM